MRNPFLALGVVAIFSLTSASAWAKAAQMLEYQIGRAGFDAQLPGAAMLQVELWYPAQKGITKARAEGSPDFLFSPDLKKALVKYVGMPSMAISTKEQGKGRRGLAPAQGPWPLVVFSHGFASFSRQNNRQAEALAEAGYIVAALSHPGESLTTEYANGRVVPIQESHPALRYLGKGAKKSDLRTMAQQLNAQLDQVADAKSNSEYLAAMQGLNERTLFGLYQSSATVRREQLVQWVLGLASNAWDVDGPSRAVLQQIDRQRIALYGHSLGGVVSVAASESLRAQGVFIAAVVNLDAPQFLLPKLDSLELGTPTCFLMGGSTKAGKVKLRGTGLNRFWATSNAQACEINIEEAAHNNFTDLSWVTPLKWFGQLGPVANKKFGVWLNGFLVAYFDHHLKGAPFDYALWPDAAVFGQVRSPDAG